MIGGTPAVLAGLTTGSGLALVVVGLTPAHPDLRSALDRLHAPPVLGTPRQDHTTSGRSRRVVLQEHLGPWLDAHAPAGWARASAADLALLGISRQQLLVRKLTAALAGLAIPTLLAALLTVAGVRLTVLVPVAGTVALAAGLSLLPDVQVRDRAAKSRAEFRHAVGAYFDLVALERAAEGGPVDALIRAATVGHGWVFRRLAATLTQARLTGQAPWDALADLADQIGVSELADLADVVTLAGTDGAAIYDTLLAKARSIRAATLAATEATANSRSETMTLPAALLGIGFVVLVGYPALSRLIGP